MRSNSVGSAILLSILAAAPVAAKSAPIRTASAKSVSVKLVSDKAVSVKPASMKVGLPQNSAPNKLDNAASLQLVMSERDKYWLNAKNIVYRSTRELIAQHETELDRGLQFDKLIRGNPARKWIAITFDDGPHPGYTERLLDILKRYDAKATFFVVGELAERNPALIRREIAEGHSVGNHTYDHVSLVKIPQEYVPTEIKACGEVLQEITSRPPHLFRPPGGVYDKYVAQSAKALGYKVILWTDDPGDYASPGEKIIETRTLRRISNGGIILLHDGTEQTIAVLPDLLDYLKAHGFQTVTIDEMLK